ncbi:MAG: RluA family pseudouridine synthase [Candidatus Omnitrophota bacterium]|jgi:23S rRNA pseudouridine1911/1915/1917 synthase
MNIPVVYEDEWLLVVNKPSGLLVIPQPGGSPRTLTAILNDDAKQRGLTYRLHPCHRLDRETSGVIIYAKGKSTQKKVMDLFKVRAVKKVYVAFIHGALPCEQGQVTHPIEGAPALTKFKVLQRKKDFTIVEVYPLTGRTNQIRIHFKSIGYPIVGETRFAFRRDFKLKAKRLCLHAKFLALEHPVTKKPLFLEAPLAAELITFINAYEPKA